jgi:hypothetical protein
MKLYIWTQVLADRTVIALGSTLDIVFKSWEKKANGSKEEFEEVRTLVTLDRDALKRGERRYKVNRKYWGEHPSLKTFDLPDKEESVTLQIKKS